MEKIIKRASIAALSDKEATTAFSAIMSGDMDDESICSFLLALKTRGESVQEIIAAAKVMRQKCLKIKAPKGSIDIVGTGGDGKGTLNISTATALVVASCGISVAKHGNKNISSKSGAADVLHQLGVDVMLKPNQIENSLRVANIAFMMAPMHHPAVKHVMPARQKLKTRTIFNILGPLTNPADVKYQLTGVFNKDLLVPMAQALKVLGSKRAWIVHGSDGTDELSICGPSYVAELSRDVIREFKITPSEAGLPTHKLDEIVGGEPKENADALVELLNGEESAYRNAVLYNSAAALLIGNKVRSLREGVVLATKSIDNGAARLTLKKLVNVSTGK